MASRAPQEPQGGGSDASETAPHKQHQGGGKGQQQHHQQQGSKHHFKRNRSGSNHGGWIRIGKNGKPLHHGGHHHHGGGGPAPAAAAAAGAGTSGSARDPISAVAASASKWRRQGSHRVVRQPAHPSESLGSRQHSSGNRSRSSGRASTSSNDDRAAVDGGGRGARRSRHVKQRNRNRRGSGGQSAGGQAAVSGAIPESGAEADVDDAGAAAFDSSDEFDDATNTEGGPSPDSMPADAGSAHPTTRPSTAYPTPATATRFGSASLPRVPALTVTLRPTVRCTDGVSTLVRTLHDIMHQSAGSYALEADTPLVRPADAVRDADDDDAAAGAAASNAMPSISLGPAVGGEGDEDDTGVSFESQHPSTGDLTDGYHGMHRTESEEHHRPQSPEEGEEMINAGVRQGKLTPPVKAKKAAARYLSFPPSAFTVEGITTPNTFYAMPQVAVPPPLPERHTYQEVLNGFDAARGVFHWHADPVATERFATQLEHLCAEVTSQLRTRSLLRRLDAPAYVLGDIHGNFADLSFFLKSFLVMNDIHLTPCQVLCLGDYVDRGPHSVECVALLFALFAEAPDRVVLLRGNHEDRVVCGDHRTYGDDCFWAQCCRRFGPERGTRVFRCVTRVFKDLPLACELTLPDPGAPKILCTHGGFPRFTMGDPQSFRRLELLRRDDFPRLLTLFPNNPLAQDDSGTDEELPDFLEAAWFTAFDLMWSDPTTAEDEASQAHLDENGFCCNVRGLNVMSFSQRAVEEYLRSTGYAMLFRAHQEKQYGLRVSKSSRVLTLFSSSNYQGHGNGAGCAVVDARGNVQLVMKHSS